jgi:thiol-disulfide isomerase/thioredoxin
MKRRTAPFAAASLLLPAAWERAAFAAPAQLGQAVAWPDVQLLDGSPFGATQVAGKAVVVVFWSTTCPFCKRHNQHVEKLHRAAQAASKPLVVLGVARDGTTDAHAAAVKRYAHQQGYSFAITLQAAPLQAALASRNIIPLTATVTRQGRLKQVLPGEMFEEDVLELLQLADAAGRA